MAKNCSMCGSSNEDALEFCKACGSPLVAAASKKKDDFAKSDKAAVAKTMIGVQTDGQPVVPAPSPAASATSPVAPGPATAPTPGAAANLGTKRTVLGMVSPLATGAVQPQPAAAAPAPGGKPPMAKLDAPPTVAQPEVKDIKRTVLGIPAVTAQRPAPGPAAPAVTPAPGTQRGLQNPSGFTPTQEQPWTAAGAGQAATEVQQAVTAPISGAKESDTAYGETAEQRTIEDAPAPQEETPQQRAEEKTKPAEPALKAQPKAAPKAAAEQFHDDDDYFEDDESIAPSKSGNSAVALVVVAIVAALLFLGLLGGGVYYFLKVRGSVLTPQIFRTADSNGLAVALSFPKAPAGTSVQMNDQTVPVVAGQARLNLAMDQLQLGVNQVSLLYAEPGSAPKEMSFELLLRHVVKEDLAGLAGENPSFVLNFHVAVGMQLHVEGNPVQLNGGVYDHNVTLASVLPPGGISGDTLVHRVNFKLIDSAGNIEEGGYPVNIPVTSLRLDRPADNAVVDFGEINCSGMSEPGALVTVNGQTVTVTENGFNTQIPLPVVGEYKIEIVAKAAGKAPRTEMVTVKRIESLLGIVKEWAQNVDKRLDYPTLGRDPNSHAGKKIKIDGRIVNINTERGVTAFLLYVSKGCPAGARCAVYVVYRGEMDAGLQSWVSVYGEVRGTRAVDLPGGSKLHVPAVDAVFVVKGKAPKLRRRR